jgi:hypothetical protein
MKGLGEIFSMVQKHVISMSARTMLKYCFMIQQARVKKMRELEESLGMLFLMGIRTSKFCEKWRRTLRSSKWATCGCEGKARAVLPR